MDESLFYINKRSSPITSTHIVEIEDDHKSVETMWGKSTASPEIHEKDPEKARRCIRTGKRR